MGFRIGDGQRHPVRRQIAGFQHLVRIKDMFEEKYVAKIRTYLETCARNGINEFDALLRLTQDNPFSLSEVLSWSGS